MRAVKLGDFVFYTMETMQKQVLQVNREYLIENIGDPDEVTNLLYKKKVFTDDMRQQVEVRKALGNIFFCIVEYLFGQLSY